MTLLGVAFLCDLIFPQDISISVHYFKIVDICKEKLIQMMISACSYLCHVACPIVQQADQKTPYDLVFLSIGFRRRDNAVSDEAYIA